MQTGTLKRSGRNQVVIRRTQAHSPASSGRSMKANCNQAQSGALTCELREIHEGQLLEDDLLER
jgi:hypothetical protein